LITDVGRARPIAEGRAADALGRGYVMTVDALLGAVYPKRMIPSRHERTEADATTILRSTTAEESTI
jgi:hypothetical protein